MRGIRSALWRVVPAPVRRGLALLRDRLASLRAAAATDGEAEKSGALDAAARAHFDRRFADALVAPGFARGSPTSRWLFAD
jgi:hypothetical protein